MLKNYTIVFSYENGDFEKKYFRVENIAAENRTKAFDKAILEFNQSITLAKAFENGNEYYSQFNN